MAKKESKCVACGKTFSYTSNELHAIGIPIPPEDAASIHVNISGPTRSDRSKSQFSYWHTICPSCGEWFAEAARDQVVLQALVDLLGWYVRQAIDLKKAADQVRGGIKAFQQEKGTEG